MTCLYGVFGNHNQAKLLGAQIGRIRIVKRQAGALQNVTSARAAATVP